MSYIINNEEITVEKNNFYNDTNTNQHYIYSITTIHNNSILVFPAYPNNSDMYNLNFLTKEHFNFNNAPTVTYTEPKYSLTVTIKALLIYNTKFNNLALLMNVQGLSTKTNKTKFDKYVYIHSLELQLFSDILIPKTNSYETYPYFNYHLNINNILTDIVTDLCLNSPYLLQSYCDKHDINIIIMMLIRNLLTDYVINKHYLNNIINNS